MTGQSATFEGFLRFGIRIGTVVRAADFPQARRPARRLWTDFARERGAKKSSARIAAHDTPENAVGCQVLAEVNFPPRQISPMRSEVLTFGTSGGKGEIVPPAPDPDVPNGSRLYRAGNEIGRTRQEQQDRRA